MSQSANSQLCAVAEGSGVYDLQRRRNALPYIFEDVDVGVMLKRLDVNAASNTSGNSCGTTTSPSSSYSADSSAVFIDVTDDLLNNCSDIVQHSQRDCQQVWSGQHCDTPTHTHRSTTASRSCHTYRNDEVDVCPRGVSSVLSSSNDSFQPSSSTTTSMAPVPERERNVNRNSSACGELSDNCHTVAGFRPEDCAKRSLIF